MTSEQFAYWLQGYAELNSAPPTAEQWQSIMEHLALVFTKVTPALQQQPPHYPIGSRSPIHFEYVPYAPSTALPASPVGPTTTIC